MKIELRDLCFGYAGEKLFSNLSADFTDGERPLVILGPSGSGKTTLLKLLGGLLKPQSGSVVFYETEPALEKPSGAEGAGGELKTAEPRIAFVFQEPRLLPWLSVLENVSLPLEKHYGREEARARARRFLSLAFLEDKAEARPRELSGGQAQRVSMARAFAWPAPALFMDEPFQSLDIPLRLSLMDLTLSLLREEKRLLIAVTHDPREALYMGGRIIVLGKPGGGFAFDRIVEFPAGDYSSAAAVELERELILALKAGGNLRG